jgi:Domain of unknown function (DUF4440)
MKTLFPQILLAVACFAPLVTNASEVVPSKNANDIAVIKQISRDMGDAMVDGDIAKLNQIFADDWVTIGSAGKIVTKESVLSGFKSGGDKLTAYELGPIDVQVLGNVAVAHGGVVLAASGH